MVIFNTLALVVVQVLVVMVVEVLVVGLPRTLVVLEQTEQLILVVEVVVIDMMDCRHPPNRETADQE